MTTEDTFGEEELMRELMREMFIQAIHDKRKIELRFHSDEDGHPITRKCAPMDYGPSRRAKDKTPRFHSWDYESDRWPHTLSLLRGKIISMDVLDERFDPAEFITWNAVASPWFVPRDWGVYS